MTPSEGVLLAVAICGWVSFGLTVYLAKDVLEFAREMYNDLYEEEAEENTNQS